MPKPQTADQSPTEAPEQESALDSLPPEDRPGGANNKPKRKRAWCVVRLQDYRLQALAPSDPAYPSDDLDWADIGADTYADTDREAVFQTARANQGLLMSTDGLPSPGRVQQFKDAVKRLLGIPF